MKKAILAILFIAGMAFAANAQRAPQKAQYAVKTPEQRAAHITETLSVKLKLTARQVKMVHRIYLSQAIEMDSIRNYPSKRKRADMQQKKAIRKTTDQEIMGVLSAGQQQYYIQYQKMIKQKRMNKRAGKAAPTSAPDDDDNNTRG